MATAKPSARDQPTSPRKKTPVIGPETMKLNHSQTAAARPNNNKRRAESGGKDGDVENPRPTKRARLEERLSGFWDSYDMIDHRHKDEEVGELEYLIMLALRASELSRILKSACEGEYISVIRNGKSPEAYFEEPTEIERWGQMLASMEDMLKMPGGLRKSSQSIISLFQSGFSYMMNDKLDKLKESENTGGGDGPRTTDDKNKDKDKDLLIKSCVMWGLNQDLDLARIAFMLEANLWEDDSLGRLLHDALSQVAFRKSTRDDILSNVIVDMSSVLTESADKVISPPPPVSNSSFAGSRRRYDPLEALSKGNLLFVLLYRLISVLRDSGILKLEGGIGTGTGSVEEVELTRNHNDIPESLGNAIRDIFGRDPDRIPIVKPAVGDAERSNPGNAQSTAEWTKVNTKRGGTSKDSRKSNAATPEEKGRSSNVAPRKRANSSSKPKTANGTSKQNSRDTVAPDDKVDDVDVDDEGNDDQGTITLTASTSSASLTKKKPARKFQAFVKVQFGDGDTSRYLQCTPGEKKNPVTKDVSEVFYGLKPIFPDETDEGGVGEEETPLFEWFWVSVGESIKPTKSGEKVNYRIWALAKNVVKTLGGMFAPAASENNLANKRLSNLRNRISGGGGGGGGGAEEDEPHSKEVDPLYETYEATCKYLVKLEDPISGTSTMAEKSRVIKIPTYPSNALPKPRASIKPQSSRNQHSATSKSRSRSKTPTSSSSPSDQREAKAAGPVGYPFLPKEDMETLVPGTAIILLDEVEPFGMTGNTLYPEAEEKEEYEQHEEEEEQEVPNQESLKPSKIKGKSRSKSKSEPKSKSKPKPKSKTKTKSKSGSVRKSSKVSRSRDKSGEKGGSRRKRSSSKVSEPIAVPATAPAEESRHGDDRASKKKSEPIQKSEMVAVVVTDKGKSNATQSRTKIDRLPLLPQPSPPKQTPPSKVPTTSIPSSKTALTGKSKRAIKALQRLVKEERENVISVGFEGDDHGDGDDVDQNVANIPVGTDNHSKRRRGVAKSTPGPGSEAVTVESMNDEDEALVRSSDLFESKPGYQQSSGSGEEEGYRGHADYANDIVDEDVDGYSDSGSESIGDVSGDGSGSASGSNNWNGDEQGSFDVESGEMY